MRISSLIAIVISMLAPTAVFSEQLQLERLTWAGVKLISGDTTVLIDAINRDIWDGKAPEGFAPVTADTGRRYALLTHAHNDHFDAAGLGELLGDRGYVICHESIATHVASRGLRVISARTWEPVSRGGFVFTAVPASDGFGSEQVSWIIRVGGKTLFHGGDTLWHGQFGLIGQQFGPVDVAFLPINGARLQSDPVVHSPGVMTPSQAVDAASLLQARLAVPIHFGLNDPPFYTEVDEPLNRFNAAAQARGLAVQHLRPGASLSWPSGSEN